MSTNLTRRTALAGAAAGTLIPVAGLAQAATTPNASDDPAILAFRVWQALRREEDIALDQFTDLERAGRREEAEDFNDTVVSDVQDAVNEAVADCAATVPTTPAGLVASLTVAVVANDAASGARRGAPEDCLLAGCLVAAERFAGVSLLADASPHDAEQMPDEPETMFRAWMERREKYDAARARLAEVSQDRSARAGLHRMRFSGEMDEVFLDASIREGWSLDYVLEGVEPKFRPATGGNA